MKKTVRNPLLFILCAALIAPAALFAQQGEKEKNKEKKEGEQIIITRTGEGKDKVVIEVDGDKVTINGKPADEYKGEDVRVHRSRIKDVWAFGGNGRGSAYSLSPSQNFRMFSLDSNRALLGVTTDKNEKGAEVEVVNEKSAASKAGLKKGDIITRLGDKKINNPDDLSAAIKAQKPGDKVSITYLRDNKEQKAEVELGKWEGHVFTTNGQNFNFDRFDFDINEFMPKVPEIAQNDFFRNRIYASSGPRLGISVQDSEDGKGVNVIEVDEDTNGAKAGIKEGDVITEIDGKAVNSADEVAKIIKESKDKVSVNMKLKRNGKTQSVEVKIPRKLKRADL